MNSRVVYEVPDLEKQISLFKYFIDLNEKFRNSLYLEYPNLKEDELNDAVSSIYQSRENELRKVREEAQRKWDEVEEKVLKEFSNILQKEWKLETIPGGISLLPFSTRDLKEKRFDVYFKKDIQSILKTTTHELFHFIYFDKWKEIFPNTSIEEMDYPNPTWALSEIALPIMLNNSKVKNILGIEFKSYPMFENEEYEGESIVLHIKKIYQENGIEDFLKKSYEYILKYYKEKDRSNE